MIFEQTIASQIGYFATMLYNPNNVAAETSPVTTRLELEVAAQLARMIGYEPEAALGASHLRRHRRQLRGALDRPQRSLPASRARRCRRRAGRRARHPEAGRRLAPDSPSSPSGTAERRYRGRARSVADASGVSAAGRRAAARSNGTRSRRSATRSTAGGSPRTTAIRSPPASCWWPPRRTTPGRRSSARSASGPTSCVFVPVDARCRMDPDALWAQLSGAGSSTGTPILACVSVCGTTEESAVDRLDQVLEVRERAERGARRHLPPAFRRVLRRLRRRGHRRADGTRRTAAEIRSADRHRLAERRLDARAWWRWRVRTR